MAATPSTLTGSRSTQRRSRRSGLTDKVARRVVQLGFLALFIYPLIPTIYHRVSQKPAPVVSSWLLPWDPLLLVGHALHGNSDVIVIGAPLVLLALTAFLGRFFCGWVCPVGTVLDLVRAAADAVSKAFGRGRSSRPHDFWVFSASANHPLRYFILAGVLVGGLLSIQALGALDPLVIFHRALTAFTSDAFMLDSPGLRVYFSASAIFLGIIILELWQPRFWCRHLCPLGALLGLTARRSLLNRRVSTDCNACNLCRRGCPMQAIPQEGHDTQYQDCHLCLECEAACPQGAISFGPDGLAGKHWQRESANSGEPIGRPALATGNDGPARPKTGSRPGRLGRYVGPEGRSGWLGLGVSRRAFFAGVAAGTAGLALSPALQAVHAEAVVRPPGALPEAEFLRTCILCQECVRVCPSGGLRPTIWQAGAAGVGTPHLVARQGGCQAYTSCPNLCARVCPAGAIEVIPKEKMQIALAHVERSACLAWDQGVKCLVCVEACPTGAAQPFNGRVTVDPEQCIGCGLCEHACPVAMGAIHVEPLA